MKKPILAEIQQIVAELEADGLLRHTGEFRDGRPVYEITERGKQIAELEGLIPFISPRKH